MTTLRVRTGYDTWAGSANASQEHGDDKGLRVATGAEFSYIHIKNPAPRGATVQSATLYLSAKGASTGSRTLTLTRPTATWKASTLNWNNKPAVTTATQSTAAVTALADKDRISFTVTADVQAWCDGTANYGWRLATTGASHRFYGFDNGADAPVLVVVFAEKPATPTGLSPSGGRVGVALPTLTWDYGDIHGADMVSYQVQADTAANGASPAYDSTEVSSASPQHPLAGTTFTQLSVDGNTTQWRVRVKDTGGLWSSWSDWSTMTRDDKGTLTITNPAASPSNFVLEPTPPITATFTGETAKQFKVLITPAGDRSKFLHDSGRKDASTLSYTLPAKSDVGDKLLVSGKTYSVCVRVWDAKKDRQGSPANNDEPYVEAWRDFTVNESATPTVATMSGVAQFGTTPAADITWTRATAPDSWVILRDGEEIASGLLPVDTLVTGTTYTYRDWTTQPGKTHTYKVRAVVNGAQSVASSGATITVNPEGVWLIDPDTSRYVTIAAGAPSDWEQVEVGDTYQAVASRKAWRVTQVLGGLQGNYSGRLSEQRNRTVAASLADFWKLKETAPFGTFRLVSGPLNIPAQVYNMTCSPSEVAMKGFPRYNVGFSFWQVGEFEFESRV